MAKATVKTASKAEPAKDAVRSETAGAAEETTGAAAANVEHTVELLNEEAFESAVEIQMSMFEAASRFAQEFSDFAARRAKANIADFSSFAAAKSPPELMQMQLGHMRTMFEDYSAEASRLMTLTQDVMKESGEAVRSSYLNGQDLKKAS